MIIDERYEKDRIVQFASQMEFIEPKIQKQLEAMFVGTETDEFYAGLLSGFATALTLVQSKNDQYLPVMLAFLASKVRKAA